MRPKNLILESVLLWDFCMTRWRKRERYLFRHYCKHLPHYLTFPSSLSHTSSGKDEADFYDDIEKFRTRPFRGRGVLTCISTCIPLGFCLIPCTWYRCSTRFQVDLSWVRNVGCMLMEIPISTRHVSLQCIRNTLVADVPVSACPFLYVETSYVSWKHGNAIFEDVWYIILYGVILQRKTQ